MQKISILVNAGRVQNPASVNSPTDDYRIKNLWFAIPQFITAIKQIIYLSLPDRIPKKQQLKRRRLDK
jgi:hypothetical protein